MVAETVIDTQTQSTAAAPPDALMVSRPQDSDADIFEAWRRADTAARAAEGAVRMAFLHALDGHGNPPDVEDRERAKRLRAHADALLQVALDAVKAQTRPGN